MRFDTCETSENKMSGYFNNRITLCIKHLKDLIYKLDTDM